MVVGADRIAANGDVANKVGTYGLALAARQAGIPALSPRPSRLIDEATKSGAAILELARRGGRDHSSPPPRLGHPRLSTLPSTSPRPNSYLRSSPRNGC